MHKMTQAEFNALERNKSGYLVIPEYTDCTRINFGAVDKVIFGDGCTLGNYCELGNYCVLGDDCELGSGCKLGGDCVLGYGCILGNGCVLGDKCKLCGYCVLGNECKLGKKCRLGEWCSLGEYNNVRATFEDGRVVDGLYIQIGNIGSKHRTAYFYIDKDGAMFVRAGCWFSGIELFKLRVKSVYGGTIYEAQYMAACDYAKAVLPLMLKESDTKRKEQHEN